MNRHVKKPVGSKWYDLGIDLLEKDDVKELNTIRSQYPADLNTCCTEMFQLWLRKQPTASWNQLLDSLRQPGIDLDNLASEIEQMLLPAGVYVVVCIVHVCICHISLLNYQVFVDHKACLSLYFSKYFFSVHLCVCACACVHVCVRARVCVCM